MAGDPVGRAVAGTIAGMPDRPEEPDVDRDVAAGEPAAGWWSDRMVRLAVFAVAGVVVLAAVLFLVTSKTETPTRPELIDALKTSGLSTQESACAADAILDTVHGKELESLVERGPGGLPDDQNRTDQTIDKVTAALATCSQQASTQAGGTVESTTTTPTTLPIAGTTPTTALGVGDDEIGPAAGSAESSTTVPASTTSTPAATSAP